MKVESRRTVDELDRELDVVALTRRLVDIESVTYNEGAVGRELARILEERGFAVETMAVLHPTDEDLSAGAPVAQPAESRSQSERLNVYAVPHPTDEDLSAGAPVAHPTDEDLSAGAPVAHPTDEDLSAGAPVAGERPDVVFSTHMDTVPPFFASSEDEEFIYGRGACDAKGIIAAQIAAAERLRAQGARVGLLFVVGEERDSAGAKLANERPRGSRFLINGEPTDNRLAVASKGTLRVKLTAKGKMAHSAYPELGESAIHKLIEALGRVMALKLPVTEDVGPSTLNVGVLEGGRAPNVIADHAQAQLLIRLVGPSEETKAAVRKAVEGLAEAEFTLEIPFQRLRAVEGMPTMVAAFTTDIPFLGAWGEPLLLGPGSIHVAHTEHERVAKRELREAVELYVKVVQGLAVQTDATSA